MTTENASRPDPTPENPPELIDNWPAWNAAQMRALHGEPTPNALTDFIFIRKKAGLIRTQTINYDLDTESPLFAAIWNICAEIMIVCERNGATYAETGQSISAPTLETRLRDHATLTDAERSVVESITNWLDLGEHLHDYQARNLLAIIARLTGDDSGRDGAK